MQRRLAHAIAPLAAQKGKASKTTIDVRCQLTLSSAGPFQHIANATYVPALAPVADADGRPEGSVAIA